MSSARVTRSRSKLNSEAVHTVGTDKESSSCPVSGSVPFPSHQQRLSETSTQLQPPPDTIKSLDEQGVVGPIEVIHLRYFDKLSAHIPPYPSPLQSQQSAGCKQGGVVHQPKVSAEGNADLNERPTPLKPGVSKGAAAPVFTTSKSLPQFIRSSPFLTGIISPKSPLFLSKVTTASKGTAGAMPSPVLKHDTAVNHTRNHDHDQSSSISESTNCIKNDNSPMTRANKCAAISPSQVRLPVGQGGCSTDTTTEACTAPLVPTSVVRTLSISSQQKNQGPSTSLVQVTTTATVTSASSEVKVLTASTSPVPPPLVEEPSPVSLSPSPQSVHRARKPPGAVSRRCKPQQQRQSVDMNAEQPLHSHALPPLAASSPAGLVVPFLLQSINGHRYHKPKGSTTRRPPMHAPHPSHPSPLYNHPPGGHSTDDHDTSLLCVAHPTQPLCTTLPAHKLDVINTPSPCVLPDTQMDDLGPSPSSLSPVSQDVSENDDVPSPPVHSVFVQPLQVHPQDVPSPCLDSSPIGIITLPASSPAAQPVQMLPESLPDHSQIAPVHSHSHVFPSLRFGHDHFQASSNVHGKSGYPRHPPQQHPQPHFSSPQQPPGTRSTLSTSPSASQSFPELVYLNTDIAYNGDEHSLLKQLNACNLMHADLDLGQYTYTTNALYTCKLCSKQAHRQQKQKPSHQVSTDPTSHPQQTVTPSQLTSIDACEQHRLSHHAEFNFASVFSCTKHPNLRLDYFQMCAHEVVHHRVFACRVSSCQTHFSSLQGFASHMAKAHQLPVRNTPFNKLEFLEGLRHTCPPDVGQGRSGPVLSPTIAPVQAPAPSTRIEHGVHSLEEDNDDAITQARKKGRLSKLSSTRESSHQQGTASGSNVVESRDENEVERLRHAALTDKSVLVDMAKLENLTLFDTITGTELPPPPSASAAPSKGRKRRRAVAKTAKHADTTTQPPSSTSIEQQGEQSTASTRVDLMSDEKTPHDVDDAHENDVGDDNNHMNTNHHDAPIDTQRQRISTRLRRGRAKQFTPSHFSASLAYSLGEHHTQENPQHSDGLDDTTSGTAHSRTHEILPTDDDDLILYPDDPSEDYNSHTPSASEDELSRSYPSQPLHKSLRRLSSQPSGMQDEGFPASLEERMKELEQLVGHQQQIIEFQQRIISSTRKQQTDINQIYLEVLRMQKTLHDDQSRYEAQLNTLLLRSQRRLSKITGSMKSSPETSPALTGAKRPPSAAEHNETQR